MLFYHINDTVAPKRDKEMCSEINWFYGEGNFFGDGEQEEGFRGFQEAGWLGASCKRRYFRR